MDNQVLTIEPKEKHQHTLIWIHGLGQQPTKDQTFFDNQVFKKFRILIPKAPVRFVTVMNKQEISWFDIKFRGQKSFIVPFDEAFSSAQVHDSFENHLKPLILKERQYLNKVNEKGKLVLAGFSQGCGMSLHSYYELPHVIDYVIGAAGYLFPFSKYSAEKTKGNIKIIYGLNDDLRPWEYTKVTYEKKFEEGKDIILLHQTGHKVNQKIKAEMASIIKAKL